MPERDLIPGEIAAALDRLAEADVAQTRALERLSTSVDRLSDEVEKTYVRRDLHDEQMKNLRADLAGMADSIKWVGRTVAGGIVAIVVAAVVAYGGIR